MFLYFALALYPNAKEIVLPTLLLFFQNSLVNILVPFKDYKTISHK